MLWIVILLQNKLSPWKYAGTGRKVTLQEISISISCQNAIDKFQLTHSTEGKTPPSHYGATPMLDHRLGNYVFHLILCVDPGKSPSFAAKEFNFGFIRPQNGLPKLEWLV